MNLMNITSKVDILSELKQGNTDVLKGMPPVQAMQYGLALQSGVGQVQESPINDEAVNKAMLNRMADSGVKEALLKQIEQEEKTKENAKLQAEQKEVKQQETKQIESVDQLAVQLNKLLNNQ